MREKRVNSFVLFLTSMLCLAVASCDSKREAGAESKSTFSSIFSSSPENTELSPSEYTQWVQNEENGLKKDREIGELTFSVQYKPLDYVVCLEQKSDAIKSDELAKNRRELEGMEYFDLKILLNSGEGELLKYQVTSPQEYDKRVRYFSFEFQKDITLVDGKDTIPCALFHFERAYDVAPYSKFLLGFNSPGNKNQNTEKTLIIHDKTYEKGIVKFVFTASEFNHIPKLKTL